MTWEFERMIEQAQRDAKAAADRQQAAQEREEAERAAHQEWLRQILHKAPLMAKALTEKGEKTRYRIDTAAMARIPQGPQKKG